MTVEAPVVRAEAVVSAYRRVELEDPGAPSVTVCELAGPAVAAGSVAVAGSSFRVELRPAGLPAWPRRRA